MGYLCRGIYGFIPALNEKCYGTIPKKTVLASQSPRRKELLQMAGLQFEVRPVDVEESYPPTLPAAEVAAYLAEKKARAARHLVQPGEILLTADSIVALEEEIFGKPSTSLMPSAFCKSSPARRIRYIQVMPVDTKKSASSEVLPTYISAFLARRDRLLYSTLPAV
ncbi:MAG: Maf family protein [Saprospirales bacterium]|nr:Maf family protein [Saprospirales bacterium]